MSWQTDAVALIRTQVQDLDYNNYTYTDDRLEEVFIVAAYNIINDVSFNTSYVVNITNSTISPDPVSDTYFMSLTALKASCLILFSEYKTAGSNSIMVTDGPSTINYSGVAKELKEMWKHCLDQYDQLKLKYSIGEGSSGQAILTPYSPGSNFYNYRGRLCR